MILSECGDGEDSLVEVHADGVVVLDVLVEQALHEAVGAEGLFDLALSGGMSTRRPSLVRRSIGRKNFTSLGLKNMKRIVERRRLILNG